MLTSDRAEQYDVFISYAHDDDEVPEDKRPDPGFVTRLVNRIRTYGRVTGGKQLTLFFDQDLASGRLWKPSIFKALKSCRIFVPIVSPSWLSSKWCGEEWDAVWNRVSTENLPDDQTRIIPVSFELDRLRKSLQEGAYTAEQKQMQERICKVTDLQLKRRFELLMEPKKFEIQAKAFVCEIWNLLDRLKSLDNRENDVGERLERAGRSTVFLGFAFSDEMRVWKESIRRGLKAEKWDISEVQFRGNETGPELSEAIRENIRGAAAVVHFLEKNQGPVEIQRDVAKQMEKDVNTLQFFWTGPDLKLKDVRDEEYKKFLYEVSGLDEHLTESEPTFRNTLLKSLKDFREPPQPLVPSVTAGDNERPVICVICESGDEQVAEEIQRHFTRVKKWSVRLPKVEVDGNVNVPQKFVSSEYAKVFKENEYFIFYWGKGTRQWCEDNFDFLLDSRRVPGGNARYPKAALLYCGEKQVKYKEDPSFWPGGYLTAYRWDGYDQNAKEVQQFISQVETLSRRGNTPTGGQFNA